MNDTPRNPDQPLDATSSSSKAGSDGSTPSTGADKSEHVPPIIIKSGSFLIDLDEPLIAPVGVFIPPFDYAYPDPFDIRSIRVTGSPVGAPETLYYVLDPGDCKIELQLLRTAGTPLNLTFTTVPGVQRSLKLTTLDHALPQRETTSDLDRPHRYQYADDDTTKLGAITIRDAGGQILFRASGTPDLCIGIWRQHAH